MLFNNATCDDEINLRSVCSIRAKAMANMLIKEKYFNAIDKNSYEYACLSGTVENAENTRNCILSVFDQHMRLFSSQNVLIQLLSSNDIDFSLLGRKKTALFLIMPDEKTTYHKLISVFIKQCYEQLISEAQNFDKMFLPNRVNFVLDEFSSIPTIKDFPAMISAARSRNIRFNLVIQSEHQLKARYCDDSQTIKSNCNNWFFLTSRELPLLKEISELSGYKNNRNIPLIPISKLQRLDKEKGEVLIFHGRLYPYISTLADICKYPGCEDENIRIEIPRRKDKALKFFDFIELSNNVPQVPNTKKMIFLIGNKKNYVTRRKNICLSA